MLIDCEWHLRKRDGLQPVGSCPLDETRLAALDLRDDIEENVQTAYNAYVIPLLVFPDMEPDALIENLAKRKGVYVIRGRGDPLHDLASIVRSRRVSDALPAKRIAREVYGVTDGLIRLDAVRGIEREPARRAATPPRPHCRDKVSGTGPWPAAQCSTLACGPASRSRTFPFPATCTNYVYSPPWRDRIPRPGHPTEQAPSN